MSDFVAAINAGSSSVKFALFSAAEGHTAILRGQIESIETKPALEIRTGSGELMPSIPALPTGVRDHAGLIEFLLNEIIAVRTGTCVAIGHRVVHGGSQFSAPVIIDDSKLQDLADLIPLARSHQPHNLAGIKAARSVWPDIPQIACFDTAFHHTLPPEQREFAIPRWLANEGIRRYGFHGLSYEAIRTQLDHHLGSLAHGRIVVAHLGNGASLCGMLNKESRYTTMGFTPLDGLIMGKRPGRLDPGIILYLAQEKHMGPEAISALLNQECGLLGLSGWSSDMRDLVADSSEKSAMAIDVYLSRLVCEVGSAAAAIGGIDILVFTGGIGQNSECIRARTVSELSWLGIELDQTANKSRKKDIGAIDSKVRVLVLPTDEERVIAGHTVNCLLEDSA